MFKSSARHVWLIAAVLMTLTALPAEATCQYGGNWPNCSPKPADPSPPATPTAGPQKQKQQQAQGQGQGQRQSSRSSSQSAAGAAAGAAARGGDASAGSDVAVDLSDRGTDNSRFDARMYSLGLPPIAHNAPMEAVPGCSFVQQKQTTIGVLAGAFSYAGASADPSDCLLIDRRNALVEQCQYAQARDIDNLMVAKYLGEYRFKRVVSDDGSVPKDAAISNLSAEDCDAERRLIALQKQPVTNNTYNNTYNYLASEPSPAAACPVIAPKPKARKKARKAAPVAKQDICKR
jgi:hypothetical protein